MAVTKPHPMIFRLSPCAARRRCARGSKTARENDKLASPTRRKQGASASFAGTRPRSAARPFLIRAAFQPLPPSWHSRSSV